MRRTPGCRCHAAALLASSCLAALGVGSAEAEEESFWEIVGFSADGSHVAVDTYGWHDGSGFTYSSIEILDTKNNRYVKSRVQTTLENEDVASGSDASGYAVCKINRRKAKKLLARYAIDERLQGERPVLSKAKRLPADRASGPHAMLRETARFRWRNTQWTLVLQEVAAPNREDEGYGQPRMLDLRLRGEGKEIVLQKDRRLPRSRGLSVYAYGLEEIVTYKKTLVVVVWYRAPGFEGSDTSQLFVTARIP